MSLADEQIVMRDGVPVACVWRSTREKRKMEVEMPVETKKAAKRVYYRKGEFAIDRVCDLHYFDNDPNNPGREVLHGQVKWPIKSTIYTDSDKEWRPLTQITAYPWSSKLTVLRRKEREDPAFMKRWATNLQVDLAKANWPTNWDEEPKQIKKKAKREQEEEEEETEGEEQVVDLESILDFSYSASKKTLWVHVVWSGEHEKDKIQWINMNRIETFGTDEEKKAVMQKKLEKTPKFYKNRNVLAAFRKAGWETRDFEN